MPAVAYSRTRITGYATDDPESGPSAALALVRQTQEVASSIRGADELAAAFLAGYGPATREAYARDLGAWGDYLAGLGVEVLVAHRVHVDAFVRKSEDGGVAAATLARRLSALAGFYGYALDEGLIERSPVSRVRRPRVSDESQRLGVGSRRDARAARRSAGIRGA